MLDFLRNFSRSQKEIDFFVDRFREVQAEALPSSDSRFESRTTLRTTDDFTFEPRKPFSSIESQKLDRRSEFYMTSRVF
jgi:hypothetical protein